MSLIKNHISEATKSAMRDRDKPRVACLRLVNAEIKSLEVDRRGIEIVDEDILLIMRKMIKQRRDSIEQFTTAKRLDLVAQEEFEVEVISTFMPDPLSVKEIEELIVQAIDDAEASELRDMGNVIKLLKRQLKGKADMGEISGKVKEKLSR